MRLVQRLLGVLVLLVSVLGAPVMPISYGGMADGMSAHGMTEPMPDCPDCSDPGAQAAACVQMCASLPGVLPAGNMLFFGTGLPFVAGTQESLSGVSRLPDPKPPRATVLG